MFLHKLIDILIITIYLLLRFKNGLKIKKKEFLAFFVITINICLLYLQQFKKSVNATDDLLHRVNRCFLYVKLSRTHM